MPASVVVYTTTYCPYCDRAKSLLSRKGVAYREVGVDERSDLRSWLVAATNQRTVPQVFVNGQPLGGFTDIAALDRQGRLDPLLAREPSPSDSPTRD